VSRIDRSALCFTLTLGAAPRADSTYGIDVIHELKGGIEEGTNFELTIDGVGGLHPELANVGGLDTPSILRSLPRIGMVGNRLEFAVAEPRHFTSGIALNVDAATGSIEPDEPLLAHPLDAGDLIVPDIGCLKFPSGGITRAGVCGNVPGP